MTEQEELALKESPIRISEYAPLVRQLTGSATKLVHTSWREFQDRHKALALPDQKRQFSTELSPLVSQFSDQSRSLSPEALITAGDEEAQKVWRDSHLTGLVDSKVSETFREAVLKQLIVGASGTREARTLELRTEYAELIELEDPNSLRWEIGFSTRFELLLWSNLLRSIFDEVKAVTKPNTSNSKVAALRTYVETLAYELSQGRPSVGVTTLQNFRKEARYDVPPSMLPGLNYKGTGVAPAAIKDKERRYAIRRRINR